MSARRLVGLAVVVVAIAAMVVVVARPSTDLQSNACGDLLALGGTSSTVPMGAVARTGDVTFGVDGSLGTDGSIKLFSSTDDALPPTPAPVVVHVGDRVEVHGTTLCVAGAHENRFNVRPGAGGTLTVVYV
jgi:hypothetical protein